MRQSGSSLSPDLSFDLSPSQPMRLPALPPKFIHSKFHQQKKSCTGASEEKELMGHYCDEGTLQGQFEESKRAFRH